MNRSADIAQRDQLLTEWEAATQDVTRLERESAEHRAGTHGQAEFLLANELLTAARGKALRLRSAIDRLEARMAAEDGTPVNLPEGLKP